jgi:anhydro-N-acetylmuramic acid kinase
VGDGAALVEHLKTPIVWNLRISDVELGGEGSPLAPFFHHACARNIKGEGPIVFLNLGGMGNISWVDPAIDVPTEVSALLAFDTGRANAPINDLVQARCNVAFDKDCKIANLGTREMGALELFLAQPYFPRVPQKSLDKNDFYKMINLVKELSDPDAAATLMDMCAAGVAEAMQHCPRPPSKVLVTGGGRKNPVLMKMLEVSLECPVVEIESVGLDGDMLEAQAFAYLAVRVARGLPTSYPSTTGVGSAVSGGTLSYPSTCLR